ncbi:BglG family transcription antiterminator [Oceanobacillus locisalsi]|uniref:BglG family transcription antiterminator n=1 Tax=Oceanobacillus locisalsi TaxID=546107 RepID=A0ABW3NEM1_9BACI
MRIANLVRIIYNNKQPVSKSSLVEMMELSERSIRKIIHDSNDVGKKNGFHIELIRGKGYILHITNKKLFEQFYTESNVYGDVYNREQRINMIIAYLLQENDYVTIESIAETMEISRNTIVKDLNLIQERLQTFDLQLERKPHYGIRVNGYEGNYRRAFSTFVLGEYYLLPASDFNEFRKSFNFREVRSVLNDALEETNLTINAVALDNLVRHVRILVFRSLRHNFLSSDQELQIETEKVYCQVATKINDWIYQKYDIQLPESEVQFLAAHISGKTSIEKLGQMEKEKFSHQLKYILQKLDDEFLTDFTSDSVLVNDLLLHMLPLMKRLYYKMQLENPLIEEIYSKYANVFVIAFRFSELVEKEYGFVLSRDEAGYVAIHFAAHLERRKSMSLEKYRRIVVICETGGGSSELLRLKLESVFPRAFIMATTTDNLNRFRGQLPELFLSTIPMEDNFQGVPIIHIKHFLDDEEMRRIKEVISYEINSQTKQQSIPLVKELFKEELFLRTSTQNYLDILRSCAKDIVKKGYAAEGFINSVLEREKKFTTVYKNGVAGPHAMKLDAIKDCVSVIILEEPIEWQNKRIEIIFLINLKPGHLFLHREISRLMLQLIENVTLRKRLMQAKDYRAFMSEIEVLL